jgi:hypothetical protein
MRSLVLDLDGNRHHPRRFEPLLYPFMRNEGLVWIAAGDEGQWTTAEGTARALSLAHHDLPWQAIFVADFARPRAQQDPLQGGLRDLFLRINRDLLKRLGPHGPVRAVLVAIDDVDREAHTGRPRDPEAAIRWDLDANGLLQAPEPRVAWLFSREDVAAIDEAWCVPPLHFEGSATHDGLAALPEGLRQEVAARASAVREAFERRLEEKLADARAATSDCTPQDVSSLEQVRAQFLESLQTRLGASQVAPLADLRPGSDLLVPSLHALCSAEAARGDIVLLRLPRSRDLELQLTCLIAGLTAAPDDPTLFSQPTSSASVQLDRGSLGTMYASHAATLDAAARMLDSRAQQPDELELMLAEEAAWSCSKQVPSFTAKAPPVMPWLRSPLDRDTWTGWVERASGQIRSLADEGWRVLAVCRREAASAFERASMHGDSTTLSEGKIREELASVERQRKALRDERKPLPNTDGTLRDWRIRVDRLEAEFQEASAVRPPPRLFLVSSAVVLSAWVVIVAVAGWSASGGRLRELLAVAGLVLIASAVSATVALWASSSRLRALRREAASNLEQSGQAVVEAIGGGREAIGRTLRTALLAKNQSVLANALTVLERTSRLRRFHQAAVERHRETSAGLAKSFGAAPGTEYVTDAGPSISELVKPDFWTRPPRQLEIYAPADSASVPHPKPAVLRIGGRSIDLPSKSLHGFEAIVLTREPLEELGAVK